MKWLIEAWRDNIAYRMHKEGQLLDCLTSGLNGYWKQEPCWPRDGRTDSLRPIIIIDLLSVFAVTAVLLGSAVWIAA